MHGRRPRQLQRVVGQHSVPQVPRPSSQAELRGWHGAWPWPGSRREDASHDADDRLNRKRGQALPCGASYHDASAVTAGASSACDSRFDEEARFHRWRLWPRPDSPKAGAALGLRQVLSARLPRMMQTAVPAGSGVRCFYSTPPARGASAVTAGCSSHDASCPSYDAVCSTPADQLRRRRLPSLPWRRLRQLHPVVRPPRHA